MRTLLFIDDIRDPFDLCWKKECVINNCLVIWVRNYKNFCSWINSNGLPTAINFDHDLGEKKTGYDCALFLVNYCLDHSLQIPIWATHSSNPVGKENINMLLSNYKKFYERTNNK
jgi:hypothetical protein